MKKTNYIPFFMILMFCIGYHPILKAQNWYLDKAKLDQENGAYIDVLRIHEEMIRQGLSNEKILKNTADAYFYQGEYRKAYPKYKSLFRKYKNLEAVYYFRFAHSLKSVSRYDEAAELMQEFSAKFPSENQTKFIKNDADYLDAIAAKKDDYEISITAINSLESDFAPSYYNKKVVFTSARDTGNFTKHRHKWNESPFTKLYLAEMHPRTKELSQVEPFAKNLNTNDFHESSTAFTADGKVMYYTRNNFHNKKRLTNQKGIQLLKIYRAYWIDNQWQKEEELHINEDDFNTAHPALSPDDNYLYFASDRPGGYGKSDLWKVEIFNDGQLGEPINLGEKINTPEKETFPFIAHDGLLYFSSNGHLGLGGLDLFVAQQNNKGDFNKIQNIGAAINSRFDDFAMIIDADGNGFFSTNKNTGRYKKDNIYRLKQKFPPDFEQIPKKKVQIFDENTQTPLANTSVQILNSNYEEIETKTSDENGNLIIQKPDKESTLMLRFKKNNYEVKEVELTIDRFADLEILQVELRKRLQEIKKGRDLAVILEIEDIFFDLDKYNIREDAAIELAKVLTILKAYPDISIEIGSHTDSRATTSYNELLSQNRANSTKKWLMDKGISADRITAKGYGESNLVNHCKDGVECTEEEHQANRRSEFIIVDIKD